MKRFLILGPIIALSLVMASVPVSKAVSDCVSGTMCNPAAVYSGNASSCTGAYASAYSCAGNLDGHQCKDKSQTTSVTDYAYYEKYYEAGFWKWNFNRKTSSCNSINGYQFTYNTCTNDTSPCPE